MFKIYEDPWYDEDGVLVDEDADWEDIDTSPLPATIFPKEGEMSPFATINS